MMQENRALAKQALCVSHSGGRAPCRQLFKIGLKYNLPRPVHGLDSFKRITTYYF